MWAAFMPVDPDMMWVLMFNLYFVEFSLMISFRCGIRPALPQDQPGCSVYLSLCIPSHFTARNLVRRKGKFRLMCIYSMKYLFSPCCTIKYLGLVIPTNKCTIFIIRSFRRRAPFVVPSEYSPRLLSAMVCCSGNAAIRHSMIPTRTTFGVWDYGTSNIVQARM